MQNDYQDRLDYLYSRLDYERLGMPKIPGELRLRRMRRLLRTLGDPHLDLPIIHVAGTKGKGSTAAMLAAALTASGVRTGLYCSPHLHRLEERFCIDGSPASPAELIALVDDVREAVDQLEVDDPNDRAGRLSSRSRPRWVLIYFARRGVGAVVLEVGMGGRLDSTNVVHPALRSSRAFRSTILVNLAIRWRRSRRKRPEFSSAAGRPSAACESPKRGGQFAEWPKQRRCVLHELDVDFTYESIVPVPPLYSPTPASSRHGPGGPTGDVCSLPLLGSHQAHNAAVVLAALDLLAEVHPSWRSTGMM